MMTGPRTVQHKAFLAQSVRVALPRVDNGARSAGLPGRWSAISRVAAKVPLEVSRLVVILAAHMPVVAASLRAGWGGNQTSDIKGARIMSGRRAFSVWMAGILGVGGLLAGLTFAQPAAPQKVAADLLPADATSAFVFRCVKGIEAEFEKTALYQSFVDSGLAGVAMKLAALEQRERRPMSSKNWN